MPTSEERESYIMSEEDRAAHNKAVDKLLKQAQPLADKIKKVSIKNSDLYKSWLKLYKFAEQTVLQSKKHAEYFQGDDSWVDMMEEARKIKKEFDSI